MKRTIIPPEMILHCGVSMRYGYFVIRRIPVNRVAANNNSRFTMLSMMTMNCEGPESYERIHPTFGLNLVERDFAD